MSPALKGQRTDLSVEVLRAGQAIFCFDFEVTLVDAPAGAIFYFQGFIGTLTLAGPFIFTTFLAFLLVILSLMAASWLELEQHEEPTENIFDDAYPKHLRPSMMMGRAHKK